jgi:hypothetical protein
MWQKVRLHETWCLSFDVHCSSLKSNFAIKSFEPEVWPPKYIIKQSITPRDTYIAILFRWMVCLPFRPDSVTVGLFWKR